jgi:hypothetical protein
MGYLITGIDQFKDLGKKDLFNMGTQGAIEVLAEGEHDAAELLIIARKSLEIMGGYIKTMSDATVDEIYKKGLSTQGIEILGCKLELGSTGDRLDFDADPKYLELLEAINDRKRLLKMAVGATIIDSDGEEVPNVGLKSASKEVLKVKL